MWKKNPIPQRWCGLGGVWKKKMKERKGKKKKKPNPDPTIVHSAVHPSELKITHILFPLFLENCYGHRGGRVASCALKCLKPSQSVLHYLRLPKWNTLNTHSKVWKYEIGIMVSYRSTSHIFALPSASLVCPFCSLSLVSDSSSNVCLKSYGSLGERTGTSYTVFILKWRRLREKTTAFKIPEKIVLDNRWDRSEKDGTYM